MKKLRKLIFDRKADSMSSKTLLYMLLAFTFFALLGYIIYEMIIKRILG